LMSPSPPAWLIIRGRRKGPSKRVHRGQPCAVECQDDRLQITGGRTRSKKRKANRWTRQLTPSRAGSGRYVTPTHALTRKRAVIVHQTLLRETSGSSQSLPFWRRSLATDQSPYRV
jgi:hypothetical protein